MEASETLMTISAFLSICWVTYNVVSLLAGANGLNVQKNIDSVLSVTPSIQPQEPPICRPLMCGNEVYLTTSSSECKYDIDFGYCLANRVTFGIFQ